MHRIVRLSLTTVLLFTSHAVYSEETNNSNQFVEDPSASDPRQLVSMPDQSRELMRKDMLEHLTALNEIIGYLADNDFDAAAEVAETRMGKSSMGKHRGTGMGPGRFMPPEMKNLGMGMHDAASRFSQVAKQGDMKSAYSALQQVTSSCVACHYSYRTR